MYLGDKKSMVIAVYGAGYVGLVSAVCLAELGHQVICVDINEERITKLLNGVCPIYEKQLPELLKAQLVKGHLYFTANLSDAVQRASVHIIATGTPSLPDGSADLSQVYAVATEIARHAESDTLLITKSTVPVGTGDAIQDHVNEILSQRKHPCRIDVASNPEFLREGSAVYDFMHADRIIIGGEDSALGLLKAIYQPLTAQGVPLLSMSRTSAELAKYTANAMLACKISFINQISCIAEKVGADIDEVREGIAADHRIGPHFLQAGIGYGGSCFPKDVRALIQTSKSLDVDTALLNAIDSVNDLQKKWLIKQLNAHFNQQLQGLTIGVWGLAFKPGTDDMREASSLVTIEALLQAGVNIRVYDPVAMAVAQSILMPNQSIVWCDTSEAVIDSPLDALVIATEWQEFKSYSLSKLNAALNNAPIIDGRNCFDLSQVKAAGLAYYYSIGRPIVKGHI